MDDIFRKAALEYHRFPRPGKLEIEPTKRGRPEGAGRRGVVPAARWELADHPEYAGIAAAGLCGSPADPISLWLPPLFRLLHLSFLLSLLGRRTVVLRART